MFFFKLFKHNINRSFITFKTILFTVVLLLCIISSAPVFADEVSLHININRNVVAPEETILLKIKVTGAEDSVSPVKTGSIKNLRIDYLSTARAMEWINGKYWSGLMLQYRIIPLKEGVYKIPGIKVNVDGKIYQTEPFTIKADEKYSRRSTGSIIDQFFGNDPIQSRQRNEIKISKEMEILKNEIYNGQPSLIRYYILTNMPDYINVVLFENSENKGFFTKEVEEQINTESVVIDGEEFYKIHVKTLSVVPVSPGNYKIGGSRIIYDIRSVFGGSRRQLQYENKQIVVKKLPSLNSRDFKGDVGNFSIDVQSESFKSDNGEFILNIELKGSGNLINCSDPVVDCQKGLQYSMTLGDVQYGIKNDEIAGYRKYSLSIISDNPGVKLINNIHFDYFDPSDNKYKRAQTGSIKINFLEGVEKSQNESVNDKYSDDNKNNSILLITVVISIVLAVLAAVIFIYLVSRETRRMIEDGSETVKTGKFNIFNKVKNEGRENIETDRKFVVELLIEKLNAVFLSGDSKSKQNQIEKIAIFIINEKLDSDNKIKNALDYMKQKRYGGGAVSDEYLNSFKSDLEKILKKSK